MILLLLGHCDQRHKKKHLSYQASIKYFVLLLIIPTFRVFHCILHIIETKIKEFTVLDENDFHFYHRREQEVVSPISVIGNKLEQGRKGGRKISTAPVLRYSDHLIK